MKKILLRIVSLVLIFLLSFFAVVPIRYAKADASSWMSRLQDEAALNSVSIPGTHDSGALYSLADAFGKCQSLPIAEQLKIGVRFFDVRVRLIDNELKIVHNFVDQKTDFIEVLNDMESFLEENPSEFLIVSIKEEDEPVNSSGIFSEKLETMLNRFSTVVSPAIKLPETVGDARGKMHIISRYGDSTIGVPCLTGWKDSTSFVLQDIYIQDNYKVDSSDEKIADIKKTFEVSAAREHSLVLNYTSCYKSPSFPPSYAGITAVDINPWLIDNLPSVKGSLGVMVCDFIDAEIAGIIIGRNFL